MERSGSSRIINSYASLKYISHTMSDSDKEKDESISGLQAIFTHPGFSNRTSSVYVNQIKNYLDQELPATIRELLIEPDPNLLYSLNCSSLWLLLRQKLKKLSQFSLFQSISDKIVYKYCLIFGSLSALNDAKQKIIQPQRRKLRSNIKQYLVGKVEQESRRTEAIASQIQKSSLFKKAIASSKNLDQTNLSTLKSSLFKLKFSEKSTIIFLQKMLIYLPKVIHAHEKQIQQKGSSKIRNSRNQVQGAYREACNVILLCNYLNVYLCYRDWINNLMLHEQIEELLFANLMKEKGAHIIHRVLDDAPIDTILKEITLLQKIYHAKK